MDNVIINITEVDNIVSVSVTIVPDAIDIDIVQAHDGLDGKTIESASFIGDDIVFVNNDLSEVILTDAKITLKGEQGAQGIQGLTGSQGVQGIQGPIGLTGPQGEQGLTGLQGIQGEQGPQGLQGVQGLKGYDGNTGPQGSQGIQGIQGIAGNDGYTPIKGIDYFDGAAGVQGIQGEKGEDGISWEAATFNTTLDFGANKRLVYTSIADTSMTATKIIQCFYTDKLDEVAILNMRVSERNRTAGVGFDIVGVAPDGASGIYPVRIITSGA